MNETSAVFAAAVTIYYWWENTKGIEESSEKAMKVMQITTVMVDDPAELGRLLRDRQGQPSAPAANRLQHALFSDDALGFLKGTKFVPLLGLFGILMAFGHSVLAMSGEESLAQVHREIEHPKLKNLKRAAIVIAIYSTIFTGGATLLASMLIPDGPERTHRLPGQPHRRPGHVHDRFRKLSKSASASSSSSSASSSFQAPSTPP